MGRSNNTIRTELFQSRITVFCYYIPVFNVQLLKRTKKRSVTTANLIFLFDIKCEDSDSNSVRKASGGYCRSVDELFMNLKCKLARFQSFQKLQIRYLFLQFLEPSVLVRIYFSLTNKNI